ncbi:SCP2 sterol-binding domain-containing protein [Paraglaciecola aquimarina]|uniref:Ubiquinone biosynthesis accessory factor UbiJ n=1 Tax=Paraglaciecola aquimarina TaxID=1235557 RepID=A0ABU3SSJ0_9ALTE|nr:SCP2 sterol-binding domain-containing protein [Paraglaciecola aquimarina]MDU0352960.1 SCP2 sterol-binding domain-containing protein [Paraglaciecola aquimarina]
MPLLQLITSGIELAMNRLLQLDADSQDRLQKLSGRSLQVEIVELPWPLLFSFSEQIDVRAVMPESAEEPKAQAADCLIELNLETLPKLQDSSQLTQLIQQKKLNLIGDIYVAQTFSSLLKELDIDWEEQLSKYTGDVVAHQTFSSLKSLFEKAKQGLSEGAEKLSNNLTQTDSIAVSQNEVILFSEHVSELRGNSERLAARVALLERAVAQQANAEPSAISPKISKLTKEPPKQ